jgi:hypothetical protein
VRRINPPIPSLATNSPAVIFPWLAFGVFFSLMTGAVVLTRIAAWITSETELSRSFYSDSTLGDGVMADHPHGSYFEPSSRI